MLTYVNIYIYTLCMDSESKVKMLIRQYRVWIITRLKLGLQMCYIRQQMQFFATNLVRPSKTSNSFDFDGVLSKN